MNASVSGLPLLNTQKYCTKITTPSTLSFYHVFGHMALMREEGCSIPAIAEDLVPWMGRRRTVRGIHASDYQNYLIFINETRQKVSQVPLIMKNMI